MCADSCKLIRFSQSKKNSIHTRKPWEQLSLEDQRDKVQADHSEKAEPAETPPALDAISEEAEFIEIVDDDTTIPDGQAQRAQQVQKPAPRRSEPDFPLDAIPEEAEIIEIIDDDATIPDGQAQQVQKPAPRRSDPDFPKEALEQIRELKGQLERKDGQIEQVMEAYRSKKAETEKLRERIEKTERRRFEQSKGDFIARFVEVLDNLDRAIDSIEGSFDPDAVLQGIMLVRSRLVQLLKTEGLEKIFVRGQPFDPMHSEAAEMEDVADETQDGVVIKELQPGYMLKGSLLRPSRFVVGRF